MNILARNPKGLLLLRDELAGWIGGFDRYSGAGADRGFYLESWNGKPYSVDLVKHAGKPTAVPYASLAILGGMQPDKLREALSGADDGFAARFLYVWPEPAPYAPLKLVCDAESKARKQMLLDVGRRLRGLQMHESEKGNPVSRILPLSNEAQRLFEDVRREAIEKSRSSQGFAAGWHGKTPARSLRLALVIEHLTWATNPDAAEPVRVSAASMAHAGTFLDYAERMFERVMGGLAIDRAEADASRIAAYVQANPDEFQGVLNERSLYQRSGFSHLRNSERRKPALAALASAGWIQPVTNTTPGRKRGDWIIDPRVGGSHEPLV